LAIKQCQYSIKETKIPMEETSSPLQEMIDKNTNQPNTPTQTIPNVGHPRKPVEVIINPAPKGN
jgi:hypothetical protein